MPNLVPPITTVALAAAYRDRILAARPEGSDFEPLMTCYLTDHTTPDEIERGFRDGIWIAAKLYPAGATTNAHHGVTDIPALATVFERMETIGMPVLIHGEATDPAVDIFDRETVFMEKNLLPLLARHQGLRIVVEHVTTAETADLVRANADRVGATVTPHHLIINRTSIFQGGLRPHLYCLPVAKRERHRLALRKAVTSGAPCFFLGTDTAPHVCANQRGRLRVRRPLRGPDRFAELRPGLRRGECARRFRSLRIAEWCAFPQARTECGHGHAREARDPSLRCRIGRLG